LFCGWFALVSGFHFFEQGVEALEVGLEGSAVAFEPALGAGEGAAFGAAEMGAADDAAADELGAFEDADVLRGGGEGHLEGGGELAEVLLAVGGELAEDGAAGGVGESVKDAVEFGGLI